MPSAARGLQAAKKAEREAKKAAAVKKQQDAAAAKAKQASGNLDGAEGGNAKKSAAKAEAEAKKVRGSRRSRRHPPATMDMRCAPTSAR